MWNALDNCFLHLFPLVLSSFIHFSGNMWRWHKTCYILIIDSEILHISHVHAIFMLLRAKFPFIVGVTLQFIRKYYTFGWIILMKSSSYDEIQLRKRFLFLSSFYHQGNDKKKNNMLDLFFSSKTILKYIFCISSSHHDYYLIWAVLISTVVLKLFELFWVHSLLNI